MKDSASRVKVLHVITRLDLGGAQQNTLHTVAHLDPARFETVLVCGPGGLLDDEAKRGAFRTVFVDSLVREVSPLRDLLALLRLTNLFLQEAPDVVHTHSSKAGILGRLAAALAGVPRVVHTFHGFGFNDFQPHLVKRLYVALERLCAGLSDALVYVSRANQEYARRHGIGAGARERLIRSGVDLTGLPAALPDRAAKKAELKFGRHKPLVVSIGNLKPQKNPLDFVAVAQKVSGELPDAEFLFIGEGPLRRRMEFQIIASGLSHRFALPGWRRDAAQWLAAADVFVMTSLWEGLPRALVEALRSGLPAVCYAADGVRDVLEDGVNGYCVPLGDVARAADRVVALLKDPALREKLGKNAAASIGPEFEIAGMVRAQEALYDELVER